MILKTLEVELRRAGVIREGDETVMVACSGGIDSTVLAHAAVALLGARRVVLGHIDHAVRESSMRDAQWVADFGRSLGTAVEMTRLGPGSDDEARLREARYAALDAQREGSGAALVLLGHTLEDQAETILMRLLRTTDPSCFLGMPRVRGALLRPLLGVSRAEIVRYAGRNRLRHAEDPSNREPRYLRNRVRKELLPLIESRYRPGFARRLVEAPRDGLVEGRGVSIRADRADRRPASSPAAVRPAPPPWRVAFSRIPWSEGPIPDGRDCAVFDTVFLEAPAVRCYRPGDRIQPFGMLGSRKVADVLREGGILADNRRFMPVVVDDEDRVVWVPGFVRGHAAPVSASTRTAWVLTVRRDALQGAGLRAKLKTTAQDALGTEGSTLDRRIRGRKR